MRGDRPWYANYYTKAPPFTPHARGSTVLGVVGLLCNVVYHARDRPVKLGRTMTLNVYRMRGSTLMAFSWSSGGGVYRMPGSTYKDAVSILKRLPRARIDLPSAWASWTRLCLLMRGDRPTTIYI